MDKKGVFFLIFAFVLASATGAGIYLYLKGVPATLEPSEPDTVPVVVVRQDLTFGTKLSEDHLKVVQYPKDAVPAGAIASIDSVVSQTNKVFLVENEAVVASKLSGVGGGLSVRIPENMRAISLDVNEVTGVNGFVLPGDRVDVLVTVDNARGPNVAVTKTILQNVEVAAAGAKTEEYGKGRVTVQSVTLIVEPTGAESLALGMHQGQVHLVLRNPLDQQLVDAKSTDTKQVLGLYRTVRRSSTRSKPTSKPQPEPEPEVLEPHKFTIIRNGSITQQEAPAVAKKGPSDKE